MAEGSQPFTHPSNFRGTPREVPKAHKWAQRLGILTERQEKAYLAVNLGLKSSTEFERLRAHINRVGTPEQKKTWRDALKSLQQEGGFVDPRKPRWEQESVKKIFKFIKEWQGQLPLLPNSADYLTILGFPIAPKYQTYNDVSS